MLPIHMGKHDLFVNCSDAADAPVGYGKRKKLDGVKNTSVYVRNSWVEKKNLHQKMFM